MGTNDKRAAAIAAAIATYRKETEEQQVFIQSSLQLRQSNPWGLSARRDTMLLRRLYQLRLHKK